MISLSDLETLIAVKRLEIEKEKTSLGLSLPQSDANTNKENAISSKSTKQVRIAEGRALSETNDAADNKEERDTQLHDLEEPIPADLQRYIRKYTGLPIMLKAGEYSPNNPLIRGERTTGDALLGLGEYERRRNTLRKLRQQQYREYLDQQAKKKQEAKEQAERERREREEREEARERERRLLEQDRRSPERRPSLNYVPNNDKGHIPTNKVDTAVQVGISRPLSVAVQTDEAELFALSAIPSPVSKCRVSEAERELSPRTVGDDRPVQRTWDAVDYHESLCAKKLNREKLTSDLRHTHLPAIFDADAIQLRNVQAQQEAASRRQFYREELKNQIQEQQRIREERKCREKMLEQAEMRRLEDQLRMLKSAQLGEVDRQYHMETAMKENQNEFETRRKSLQKDIDLEHQALLRTTTQTNRRTRNTHTSKSDTMPSKLPFYYSKDTEKEKNLPYSMNIPDNSVFSPNYDVETYLRKNLNPSKETLYRRLSTIQSSDDFNYKNDINPFKSKMTSSLTNLGNDFYKSKIENAATERPKERKIIRDLDLPIPVLRHNENVSKSDTDKMRVETKSCRVGNQSARVENKSDPVENESDRVENKEGGLSEAMKVVNDKWKVPAVQKNILRSVPNEEGKNVSILTQLGSIRRQLQLEQLKLDNMMNND